MARITNDFRHALADPALDAVDICLPHDLHGIVAVAAADAGKHILCEKPIAATLPEADAMIAAADQAGVVLMIAENERFLPLSHTIRDLIRAGAIGQTSPLTDDPRVLLARSFVEERPWFLDAKAAAGGMMTAGGVHDFETARMVLGDDGGEHLFAGARRSAFWNWRGMTRASRSSVSAAARSAPSSSAS